MSTSEILQAGTLEDGLCGGGLDLGTYVTWSSIPKYKGSPDPIRYQTLTAHEDGHWARWFGSTIGMTLTSMRYASQRLIRDTLSGLEETDRRALFYQRQHGVPIFSLNGPPLIEDINVEWQMWADLHIAYSALYDSERLKSFKWDVGRAVASALSDAQYWELPLHNRPRGNFLVELNPGKIQFLQYNGVGLTSRTLFEAIALADELLAWGAPLGGSEMGAELETHYRQMLNTSYGTPHKIFLTFRKVRESSPSREAVTVSCLADFALNPPLPPYVERTANRPLNWPDIYPPIRFVRACEAVQTEGLLSSDPSDDEIRDYMARVSTLSGLPNPLQYSSRDMGLDDPKLTRSFAFESSQVGSNDHDRMEGDYVALLDWAARRLWKLRISEPGLLLLHGQRIFRPERTNKADLLIGEEGAGWYTAPFGKTLKGTVGFSQHLSNQVTAQFMISLVLYLSMHRLACQTGPFPTADFPNIPSMSHRWEEVRRAVNSIMQHQIW